MNGYVRLYGEDGRLCAEIDGVLLRAVSATAGDGASTDSSAEYRLAFKQVPMRAPAHLDLGDNWLVCCDRGGVGERLIDNLRAGGARTVVSVHLAPETRRLASDRWEVSLGELGALRERLRASGQVEFEHIAYLWALDEAQSLLPCAGKGSDVDTCQAVQRAVCEGALLLSQTASLRSSNAALWFVTCGACEVGREPCSPWQAPLWGLGRTAAREHPDVPLALVDLDAGEELAAQARQLSVAIAAAGTYPELACRGVSFYVPELLAVETVTSPHLSTPKAGDNYALVAQDNTLESLALVPAARKPPAPHEVEIEVEAAGLRARCMSASAASVSAAPTRT